jgi:hypothetical protein
VSANGAQPARSGPALAYPLDRIPRDHRESPGVASVGSVLCKQEVAGSIPAGSMGALFAIGHFRGRRVRHRELPSDATTAPVPLPCRFAAFGVDSTSSRNALCLLLVECARVHVECEPPGAVAHLGHHRRLGAPRAKRTEQKVRRKACGVTFGNCASLPSRIAALARASAGPRTLFRTFDAESGLPLDVASRSASGASRSTSPAADRPHGRVGLGPFDVEPVAARARQARAN